MCTGANFLVLTVDCVDCALCSSGLMIRSFSAVFYDIASRTFTHPTAAAAAAHNTISTVFLGGRLKNDCCPRMAEDETDARGSLKTRGVSALVRFCIVMFQRSQILGIYWYYARFLTKKGLCCLTFHSIDS